MTIHEVFDGGASEIKPYPKGGLRRGVPITGELAEQLEVWMREHPAVPCGARHRGGRTCRGSLLVSTEGGAPLGYSVFRRDRWAPMVAAIGIEATTHDMRHTYASWLVQDGVELAQVQAART